MPYQGALFSVEVEAVAHAATAEDIVEAPNEVWADVPWGEAGAAESASPQDEHVAAIAGGQGWPIAANSTC